MKRLISLLYTTAMFAGTIGIPPPSLPIPLEKPSMNKFYASIGSIGVQEIRDVAHPLYSVGIGYKIDNMALESTYTYSEPSTTLAITALYTYPFNYFNVGLGLGYHYTVISDLQKARVNNPTHNYNGMMGLIRISKPIYKHISIFSDISHHLAPNNDNASDTYFRLGLMYTF